MLENHENPHLWRLLWEYDPNGLIAVDVSMNIKVVNPAFCNFFKVEAAEIIGTPAFNLLGNVDRFKKVWEKNQMMQGIEVEYENHHLYLKEVIFPIKDENIIACIMTDITSEMQRKKEINDIREQTVKKVNEVVDNQMKVAQEIAGLLGETTAETKVSLLKIIQMINQ
ncbi:MULTISPECIES: PAS domain-containing protein [Arthrospira]|jgi:PAS domain S-box-containing protein|uniref:PAS domain-containing protein n=1 Tax=Limnospira platensis NIES-46 TaxID=1236695 RepID=A0A5M3T838_LIMPL|nr:MULTISPECIES: PAS domain-containing protein [Arthrospira]AMW30003.1 histidine kinase [Arthrospira platensis YZ]KDR53934.1 histidine kinase [Arthrospira platensis str. Paraca]MBD2670880.1 PAS domain-containing protein [Arthrospira platensis FACHB-439]MBD2713103.1 PAS domain-containing protein [Arthrospira platensis FACHB-835]MDF2211940.1 PAS domain-containing protein [Arthrospira platensis NCB002]MDT9184130.1 PAS domain-containing protein [Limnospira sp. PMC 289.06]MDT9296361.1 PAS domain-